jgi:hypothetical protein
MSVNHIGGVIVIVLALSVVKILESGQTKHYQIVIPDSRIILHA